MKTQLSRSPRNNEDQLAETYGSKLDRIKRVAGGINTVVLLIDDRIRFLPLRLADQTRTECALSHSCGDGRGARGVALLDILCTAVLDARRLRLSAEVVQRHHRLE